MNIISSNKFKSLNHIKLNGLPNFIVLSGINGAGKSHLLQGIIEGSIIKIFDDSGVELKAKKLVNSHTLSPNNTNPVTWDNLKEKILQSYGLYDKYIQRKKKQPDIKFEQSLDINYQYIIKQISINSGKEIDELESDDFFNHYPLSDRLAHNDIFLQNFAQLFKGYQIKEEENKFREWKSSQGDEMPFLTQEDFIKVYGEAPWDFLNKIIAEANLDYHILSPKGQHKDTPFKLEIVNNINGANIGFNDLSGGEKVLMSLAFSLYNLNFDFEFPEVLLMDEPDAPLHPSMTKQFLKVIENVFVKEKNVKVIMTTHSPSTVALAPENALYQMSKAEPRISKVTKDKALEILTSGVPSLSINYENRRQVFVESKNDVVFYEKVYLKTRNYLLPEISINFISSGVAGQGDCAQVKDIVNKLTGFGNRTIFGIIDWDLKNNENDFVKVLGHNKRYSIENYIFDPLLVGAYLLREKFIERSVLKLNDTDNYTDFSKFESIQLQLITDVILDKIKTNITDTIDESLEVVNLLNKKQISLPKWLMLMQGHELESKLKITFPELKRFRNEGDLKKEIINKIIDDIPEVLSSDLVELLKSVQV